MTDVLLIETGSCGDITIVSNDIAYDNIASNVLYLSMFGGNVGASTKDVAIGEYREYWWGNNFCNFGDSKMDSGTEYTLITTALNSKGRLDIEKIINIDIKPILKYYKQYNIVVEVVSDDVLNINLSLINNNQIPVERVFVYKKNAQGDYSTDYSSLDYFVISS